jgi:predicted transcriptional regulator
VRPDSPGWAALDRRGLSVSTVSAEADVPVRSVYKVLNGTAGMSLLLRFLGYHRLADIERVAIIEAHGFAPYIYRGQLVGLSVKQGGPITTIVRGQG